METTQRAVFFDSWASIELLEASSVILKFAKTPKIHTQLNVFEVCEYLIRNDLLNDAQTYAKNTQKYCVEILPEDLVIAAQFRQLNSKARLSMTDCVGYVVSRRLGIDFLTGDKAFREFSNVIFIGN